jgi:hypothetical protein
MKLKKRLLDYGELLIFDDDHEVCFVKESVDIKAATHSEIDEVFSSMSSDDQEKILRRLLNIKHAVSCLLNYLRS